MKTSVKAGLLLASVIALMASGCVVNQGGGGSSSTSGAPLSGSLTIACGAQEDWCKAMAAAFQAKTGVKTTYVRLSSGEAVTRLEGSKASPEFDVWHGGPADGYDQAKSKGLLAQYHSPNADAIDAQYKDADNYWTGVYVGALGFCSNTDVLAQKGIEVPQKWDDLLNPALAKNVEMAHPSSSGTAYTTVWTQTVLRGSEDAAIAYLKQLNANILQYPKTGSAPGEAAARGEVAVGIIFTHDCVMFAEQTGAPLKVTFPSDGTGYEIGGVAMIQGAKNPDAAKAYVDWALTAEAQNIGPTVKSYQVLTAPGAVSDPRSAKLADIKLIKYDFAAAAAAKAHLLERFNNEVAQKPA